MIKSIFNVRDFGAVGDGVTKDTVSVQKAIDNCSVSGGGRVIVPAGTYLVGTVWLKSGVELHLEKGAVLLGSPDLADYNTNDAYEQNAWSPGEGWSGKHLILAVEVENVAITGEGIIDGNGTSFLDPNKLQNGERKHSMAYRLGYINLDDRSSMARPGQELAFIESRGIRIDGVTLRNMAMWTCFMHGCDDIVIRKVTIRNDLRFANTDGFDIDACRNVTITDCDIETADDAFAIRCCPKRLKSKRAVCENIVIDNCKVRTECEVLRVGVGDGLARNIRISNLDVTDTGRGFVLQSIYPETKYTGLGIENVIISNCNLRKAVQAIMVTAGTENAQSVLRNITFENIEARFEGGVMVNGLGATRPTDIRFKNVALDVFHGDFTPCHDWELGKMLLDPQNVIRVERADNVSFEDVEVSNSETVGRPYFESLDAVISGKPAATIRTR